MKSITGVLLTTILVVALSAGLEAKEPKREQPRFYRPNYIETGLDIPGEDIRTNMIAAAADTYLIVWYDFEYQDWQSWTRYEWGLQEGTFFHVEDFEGLDGGSFGRLVPIEGGKSVWCGTDGSNSDYSCNWASAPGYGNDWKQSFRTEGFNHDGLLNASFHLVCDTESGYDYVYFEHSEYVFDGDAFEVIGVFSGVVDTVVSYELHSFTQRSKLRFRFESDGMYSDADGVYDSDGACIIDSITVSDDTGILDFEDFESYADGDTIAGLWFAHRGAEPWGSHYEDSYGTFSGLAMGLRSKEPCGENFSSVIMFFEGSSYPSQLYPGLLDTPYCTGAGGIESPCQNELVVSPVIDLTRYSTGRDEVQDASIPPGDLAQLGGVRLEYAVYSDNPLSNLVFRTHYIRNIEDGCTGEWIAPGFWFPYEPKGWWTVSWDISHIVTSDMIQVGLGVSDMCDAWYGTYGDCEYHTPAPWFDNVRVKRWDSSGPQWSVRNLDLFQDTFPQDGDEMESFCRADMAMDIAPGDEFSRIDPGDSAVVQVASPLAGGLDTLATGEAKVYFHCNVSFLGLDGKPDLTGSQLEGTYGSWQSTDGGGWDILLCEPAATSAGNIAPDKYAIDLNDSLFTRGYMIEYYFKAYDLAGNSSTFPNSAEETNGDRYEFTCLPTLRVVAGILFCDDFHNRGTFEGTVQAYFDPAMKATHRFASEFPDRYDTNGPSSGVSNGIGAYVSAATASSIFNIAYEIVYHDSGDLNSGTITDGTEHSDKSNDAQLFVNWLRFTQHKVGLLVMGDQVAYDLSNSAAPVAAELVNTICGVTLESVSYFDMTGGYAGGGIANPLITGVVGGPFGGMEYYLLGGCPILNDFDVLEATGPGQYAFRYPDYNSTEYYAGIFTDQINDEGQPMRTVWIGHSMMEMKDSRLVVLARNRLLRFVDQMFESGGPFDITDAEIPAVTSLADNFPNPFNPVTRLKFGLAKKGHVSIRIYDVSGRLVRILIDEIRDAGSYEAVWDGTNGGGMATASGIYFCRMEAPDYERTLKMVLLR
jgi:hypothetical protein